MVRRQVESPNFMAATESFDILDVQAIVVELGADDRCAGGSERLPSRRVT
jgi:hypothetical protein